MYSKDETSPDQRHDEIGTRTGRRMRLGGGCGWGKRVSKLVSKSVVNSRDVTRSVTRSVNPTLLLVLSLRIRVPRMSVHPLLSNFSLLM